MSAKIARIFRRRESSPHVAGQLQHPVLVTIQLPSIWKQISTGLEPVKGKPGTFSAENFDVLYDSPILLGNQEYLQFEVKGVPHYVAIENVTADVDRPKMMADLKTMVTAATQLIGDVPYKHYTFLMMGRGNGGIEHANSSSNQFDGNSLSTPEGYLRWLSFICHEYFHNFNVKRIRPLALGPFDYDQENLDQHAVGVGGTVGVLPGSRSGAGRADDEGSVPGEDGGGDRERSKMHRAITTNRPRNPAGTPGARAPESAATGIPRSPITTMAACWAPCWI